MGVVQSKKKKDRKNGKKALGGTMAKISPTHSPKNSQKELMVATEYNFRELYMEQYERYERLKNRLNSLVLADVYALEGRLARTFS